MAGQLSGSSNALGDFLRAQRARLKPAETGLLTGGSRRVAGLRREEVAVLAGVSADYYARLEQGRERNPSGPMLDAIGQALGLDTEARGHLFRLAGLGPRSEACEPEQVHPSLLQLLDSFPASAGYVLGPAFAVLATNAIAAALLSPFGGARSMPRILFTHPQARTVFVEWPLVAGATVRALRLSQGFRPQDPEIRSLIEELTEESAEFRVLWEDQAVSSLTRAYKVFVHPVAGRIELTYQTFDVHDAPGQQLLIGTPVPGSPSAAALATLVG